MAGTSNLWRRGAPSELASSGAVHFESGEPAADVDVVLYSSGYRYSLPFLDASSRVASIDNRYTGFVGHAARRSLHTQCSMRNLLTSLTQWPRAGANFELLAWTWNAHKTNTHALVPYSNLPMPPCQN